MSFFEYLFYLLVEPLKLLFEVIFYYAFKVSQSAWISIVVMSLVVNLLLLPLYFRADKIERAQREKKNQMHAWVDRIKKSFKGDERVMILQAYYRINNYRSTDIFKESISLFLQIPFFIAAYSFLSGLQLLHGYTLGPISDLGAPDSLLKLGEYSINILPILMTLINILSGFVYSERGQIKEKLRITIIALVFLVLLYGSPSGLVFYWTLNNLFSLGKNVFTVLFKLSSKEDDKANSSKSKTDKSRTVILFTECAILTVVTGLWIPSDVVFQNPLELVNTFSSNPHNPLMYLIVSLMVSAGVFMIWIPLFYYISGSKAKVIFRCVITILTIDGVINYAFFNKNFGLLSNKLVFDNAMSFNYRDIAINLLVNVLVGIVVCFLNSKFSSYVRFLYPVVLCAIVFISVVNVVYTVDLTKGHRFTYSNTAEDVRAPLSTQGQNVVVIMMDRMMSEYIPYIFNERPDVAEQFDGFTYYPNTISYGQYTLFGSPAVFGGYEYTPYQMNLRQDELLVDKHNESLLVLPVLFADNGWTVSVGDPTYANYEWIPDTSIYDAYEDINAFQMGGVFNERFELFNAAGIDYETRMNRNLFCYGVTKIMPYALQPFIYTNGNYCSLDLNYNNYEGITYVDHSIREHTQTGIYEQYISQYLALDSLSDIVEIRDTDENCFFMFTNGVTHDVCLLQEPEYLPSVNVDNTEFDLANADRFTLNGITIHTDIDRPELTYANYECNMAACIMLGRWFDYLRENDLFDNTRIIIVADHGTVQTEFENMYIEDLDFYAQSVNPILMVKDFGSTGFTTSYEFMTNADTPSLALQEIIDNPINPFTGNVINQDDKTGDQMIYLSDNWNANFFPGTQFDDPSAHWITVRENIFEDDNWDSYEE